MQAIPNEKYVPALVQTIETTENHLSSVGFDPAQLIELKGSAMTDALRAAVDAILHDGRSEVPVSDHGTRGFFFDENTHNGSVRPPRLCAA